MAQAIAVDLSRVLLVRLMPGELVMESFRGILDAHQIQRAVILSAIGSLAEARFFGVQPGTGRPFTPKCVTRLEAQGPFEILTLEGNVFPTSRDRVIHLHVTLGTSDGSVIGGHFVDGEVYTAVELFLAPLDQCRLVKGKDAVAGGFQLRIPKAGPGMAESHSPKSQPSRTR
jgi:predicted DNA-binding protein with PD1-like motif